MLPPSLHLAAPRALALASPQITAAVAVAVAPAAYNVALQLSNKNRNPQANRARQFHWWCRRSPRRYSSWNRSNSPNPIDGTEQRPEKDNKQTRQDNEPVVERDDFELNPREKMWQMRRAMVQRLMNKDPYEGIFGASNRMLKGLNWRNGPYVAEWNKLWEQQWKEMDRVRSEIHQRMGLGSKDHSKHEPEAEKKQERLKEEQSPEQNKEQEQTAQAKAMARRQMDSEQEEERRTRNRIVEIRSQMAEANNHIEELRSHVNQLQQAPVRKESTKTQFVDEFLGKPKRTEKEPAAGAKQAESSKESWMYDAISNRMVPKQSTITQESHEWVEIPVKPYQPKIRFSTKKSETQLLNTATEAAGLASVGSDTSVAAAAQSCEPVLPSKSAAKPQLPANDEDILTAEDVRAGMGHLRSTPKESVEQRAEQRAQLDTQFDKVQQAKDQPITRPAIKGALPTRQSQDETLWKLQREQLKEAAEDFQVREKRVKKAIRESGDLHKRLSDQLTDLKQHCGGLAKRGTLTLIPNEFAGLQATLDAEAKVIFNASHLITKAVLSAPRDPSAKPPKHMEPSLDRYAWFQKPFAKIRDAEQLIENIRESLANVQESIQKLEATVDKKVKMAGKLNDEVEAQRRAMRGIEEKWHKRKDGPQPSPVIQEQGNKEADLANEIRSIYEDHYGTITTKHRQSSNEDPALSALEEQIDIGKDDAKDAGTALENEASAMSLGAIPDLAPASLDGGPEPETIESSAPPASRPAVASSDVRNEVSISPSEALFCDVARLFEQRSGLSLSKATEVMLTLNSDMSTIQITAGIRNGLPEKEPMKYDVTLEYLARAERFRPLLDQLLHEGFAPVEANGVYAVLRRVRPSPPKATAEATVSEGQGSPPYYPESVGRASGGARSASEAEQQEPGASEGPFYSTKLQSPTSSTFQGLRPKRMERVFSGSQGGHQQYEMFRKRFRERVAEQKHRRHRRRRFARKIFATAGLLGVSCYLAGVVSELLRDGGDEQQEKWTQLDEDYQRLINRRED